MKKIILFLLSALLTTCVFAQAKKEETKLTNTIVDKKEDKHVVGNNLKHLRVKRALRTRRVVRSDKRSINRQGQHLQNHHGVRHPIHKAKLRAKTIKDEKKGRN